MLITFTCDAHETIIMFGDVAQRLLKVMGYNEAHVIAAEDIPAAITRLKNVIENEKKEPAIDNNDSTNAEPFVSLAHRAFPLIEMLDAAAKEKCDVTWKIS